MRMTEMFNPWGRTRQSGQNPLAAWGAPRLLLAAALAAMAAGCGSNSTPVKPVTPSNPSQLYFAPTLGDVYAATYALDHTAATFVRDVYGFNNSPANGATVTDSGVISTLPNGIVSLGTTYNLSAGGVQTTYNPALMGSWAVEIPGQAALIGMKAYTNFTPAVPTQSCPSFTTAQTVLFVTIPNRLSANPTSIVPNSWNPALETAFGSVKITTSGTDVKFASVAQHTLPVNGGAPGVPINPGAGNASASCSPTYYGHTIGIPNSVTIIDPGTSESVPPTAAIGIGPTGFLVEDAGSSQVQDQPYENILGAGYGAIGLPMPSAPLTASTLTAARYQGFLYGSGGPLSLTQNGPGFSLIGSFGYSDLKTSCPVLPAPAASTILYGGEFAGNDPSTSLAGNCDLAIDFGAQDTASNGLYPAATVHVTAAFPKNGIAKAYSFPAVAIAGQLQGKLAIFLIGADTAGLPSQAWGIYLLQSN